MEWKGKKVAVTGATGFIGSWLTDALAENGADITVLIRKDSPRGQSVLGSATSKVKVIYGDIREREPVQKLVNGSDIIFHLAAITQVIYSKTHPVETFEIDANGTLNVLEAIRESKADPFLVFQSTDKVYGEPEHVPISEDCRLSSKSPYDAAKMAADRLVNSYFVSYGLRGAITRPSNVIGGKDANILRVVPDFVLSVLKNKSPIIRGNGKHIRDYTYVKDTVAALKLIGEKQERSNGEIFNLGTGIPTSVLEIADLVIELSGSKNKLKPVLLNKSTPGEIDKQYLSSKKIKKVLGWEPKFSLREGLKETLEWYRENPKWQRVVERVNKYYGV